MSVSPRVLLVVRDGWGSNPEVRGNAIAAASAEGKIPNNDSWKENYPWTLIRTDGSPVGLPEGFQGSSEVGHLNMGAGRVVTQELKRINDMMVTGTMWECKKWAEIINNWKQHNSTLHFLLLLQDEGVHAHCDHLYKMMRRARQDNPTGKIVIHPFLDGRDTPPRSCLEYIAQLQQVMNEVGNATIGTVMGRYYSMDRSRNWTLTDSALDCMINLKGRKVETAIAAVEQSYANDKTPDGYPMTDEYIHPHVVGAYAGIKENDCILHTNYRQDRAIQLAAAFCNRDMYGGSTETPRVTFVGFTQYYNEFENYLIEPMTGGGGMENLLGEVVSKAGFRQLRIAETQKFRHVTSFFNGKSTKPYPLEDQVEVPSRFDAASFASHPEMEAYQVTEELIKRIDENPDYRFIVVNYANTDMVSHTGEFVPAKTAVEIVDECVGKLVNHWLSLGGVAIVTADHGNADQMIDYNTGMVKTSHTIHPVDLILVGEAVKGKKMLPHCEGKLADIAPTVLQLLGLPIPKEMTAQSLIVE
ncbi:hypothetical protein GEMRC1_000426 [Eukaryota sp. GEM-RC1]